MGCVVMASNKVKKQHYVPQFYLRLFSENNDKHVAIYIRDKKLFCDRVSVKTICYGKFFYDVDPAVIINQLGISYANVGWDSKDIDDIEQSSQFMEKQHLHSLESKTSPIIQELLLTKSGISLQNEYHRSVLAIFLVSLSERTAFSRNIYTETHNLLKNMDDPRVMDYFEKYNYDVRDFHVKNMLHIDENLLNNIHRLVFNCEWTLVYANKNEFLTSDNPAGIFSYFIEKEYCFPISNKHAILIRPKDPNQRKRYRSKKNKKYVTLFNTESVFQSNNLQDSVSDMLIGSPSSIKTYFKNKNHWQETRKNKY